MRHRVYGKHLGKNKDQRKTLFKGLVYSLISSGTIQTSEAKAKAIKGLVDKIINLAKGKNTQIKLQSYISDKNMRQRLTDEILPKVSTRTSGYTSLVKMGTRLGDQTMMVKMSLIGAEELKPMDKEAKSKQQTVEKKSEEPKKKIVALKKPVKTKTTTSKKSKKA